MTTTIRAKAQLIHPETKDLMADGIAVIWGDPDDWGGIFEVTQAADALSAAIANQAFAAELRTHDGRQGSIQITSSDFNADDEYPLTFEGTGQIDSANYHAFTTTEGRIGMMEEQP